MLFGLKFISQLPNHYPCQPEIILLCHLKCARSVSQSFSENAKELHGEMKGNLVSIIKLCLKLLDFLCETPAYARRFGRQA